MKQPRIGLVGCGAWGKLILRDLCSLGCVVHVVARSAASQERARQGGAASVVSHGVDLPPLDGIVVATPTATHADVLEEVLTRGIPVFCEKPLTNDPIRGHALAALAANQLFIMDKWRYHPGVMALGTVARSGELGQLQGLKTRRLGWGDRHADVNCVWTLLPHDLAIALEILGEIPQPAWATSEVAPDGTVLALTTLGHAGWIPHLSELSVRYPRNLRTVELLGTTGVAFLDDSYSEHITIIRNPERNPTGGTPHIEQRATPGELPLLAELRAFIGFLQGGPPPRSSAAEGAIIVEAIAEAQRLAGLDPANRQAA